MEYFKRAVIPQHGGVGRGSLVGARARRLGGERRWTRHRNAQAGAEQQDTMRCAAYTVTLQTAGLASLIHGRPTIRIFVRTYRVN